MNFREGEIGGVVVMTGETYLLVKKDEYGDFKGEQFEEQKSRSLRVVKRANYISLVPSLRPSSRVLDFTLYLLSLSFSTPPDPLCTT